MNFMMTGSIYSYTQNLKLSKKWDIKKTNGNYLQKSDSKQTGNTNSSIYSEFEQYREQLEQIQKQNDPDRVSLYAKLQTGKKLSAQEMDYLRTNDPVSYQKAKEIEAERESYKQELKRCRTKEDVERLRTTHVAMRLAVANSISHNANIPKLTKMQLMVAEYAKVKGLEEETRIFKASQNYAHMPTDAEQRQAEKEKLDALTGRNDDTEKTEETDERVSNTDETPSEPPVQPDRTDEDKEREETVNPGDLKTSAPKHTEQPAHTSRKAEHTEHHQSHRTFSHETQEHTLKKEASAIQYHASYGREIYKQEIDTISTQTSNGNRRKKA